MVSFGGSDNRLTSYESAKAVIVPVPYGRTASYRRGAENGPLAILNASVNLELFDEELDKETYLIGINTAPLVKVKNLKPGKMLELVEKTVSDVYRHDKLPVLLGGEHTVTIGAVRAARRQFKDISILYFDAHSDLRDSYTGTKYSHACVARRLMEIAPVVEAGVRSLSKEENDIALTKDIKVIKMPDMLKTSDWPNMVRGYLSENVYISIDLDVFDPSVMPSVGNPEPGGMLWYDFLKAVRSIISGKKVVGFDVVELSPIKNMVAPDFTAAKLIYKILGYIFE